MNIETTLAMLEEPLKTAEELIAEFKAKNFVDCPLPEEAIEVGVDMFIIGLVEASTEMQKICKKIAKKPDFTTSEKAILDMIARQNAEMLIGLIRYNLSKGK